MSRQSLQEAPVNHRVKIAALWVSVMFLYLYADYFGLFVPGALKSMLDGQIRPLGRTTQPILIATSLMMAIPSVMVVLTVALRARVAQVLNAIFGVLYTLIILGTMWWGWFFFIVYGVIEVTLTLLIVRYAWHWPREARNEG